MNERPAKPFDCVQNMRETRDKFSSQIAEMSYEDLVKWLRGHRYSDSLLQRLSEKAAKQAEAEGRPSPGR